jgi:hypothetical protein
MKDFEISADLFCRLCLPDTSNIMQSGSGRHLWGFDPARLAAGQHRGHAVDMRAAQGRAAGFQAHLGGESQALSLASSVRLGKGSHHEVCMSGGSDTLGLASSVDS